MVAILWVILLATLLMPGEAVAPLRPSVQRSARHVLPYDGQVGLEQHQILARSGKDEEAQLEAVLQARDFQIASNQVRSTSSQNQYYNDNEVRRFSSQSHRREQNQPKISRQHQNRRHHRRKGHRRRYNKNKYHNHEAVKMVCMSETKQVWLRNDCLDGFVSVLSDRRVAAIHEGVNEHDSLGETNFFCERKLF